MKHVMAALITLACIDAHAEPIADIDGQVQFPMSTTVAGTKLVINGAAVRKRGYFKPDAVALYLPAKVTSLDAAVQMSGPKRLQIQILRELDGGTISRYFINDFKMVSTDAEFKQLINEVAQVGAIYAGLHRLNKGDVFTIDWIPGKGMVSAMNGKPLATIASPLMYEITLRMSLGSGASAEMRDQMLGTGKPLKVIDAP